MISNRQQHWEQVYETKTPDQVSWTQKVPQTSLDFIRAFDPPKDARIIDIGGGDSHLVDFLLKEGFTHITVLDISEKALERAKNRLGSNAEKVNWIASDIVNFKPETTFDIWHDRAVFHFLTAQDEIASYVELTKGVVNDHMIIGTFSESGPLKCSGLPITQYSKNSMSERFRDAFNLERSMEEVHHTPFNTTQDFIFCSFTKK